MTGLRFSFTLWICLSYFTICYGGPTHIKNTDDDDELWQPDGQSRADWLACKGLPCGDYMKVQAIMAELNLIDYDLSSQRQSQVPKSVYSTLFGNYLHLLDDNSDDSSEMEEFDILLTPEEAQELLEEAKSSGPTRSKRKVINNDRYRWEMPIKYKFDGSHSKSHKDTISDAIQTWEDSTCVKFEQRRNNENINGPHLVFTLGDTPNYCSSFVGKKLSGGHLITLSKACLLQFGTSLHEIGHVLGLWHEHQRSNRDDHLIVHDDNVHLWAYLNFHKYDTSKDKDYGVPYDYNSVMHYGSSTGSRNGKATLQPYNSLYTKNIGQRVELSFLDIKVINLAYCSDVCESYQLRQTCKNGGYQDPKNCAKCRCPPGTGGDYCEDVQAHKSACGRKITLSPGESTTISSPNYPSKYSYGTECSWVIESDRQLSFEFVDAFNVRCDYGTCSHWVEVHTQADGSVPGYRFCCSTRPNIKLRSDNGRIVVDFRAPYPTSYDYQGFKAVITADGTRVDNNPVTQRLTTPRATIRPTTTTTRSTRTTTTTTTTTSTTPRPLPTSTTTTTSRPSTRRFTRNRRPSTTPTQTTRAFTTPTPAAESSEDSEDSYYSWTEWGSCDKAQCNCGGCSRVYRFRLCGNRRCTGIDARWQMRQCSTEVCTAADKYQIYIGAFYQRSCKECCYGFVKRGNQCVLS